MQKKIKTIISILVVLVAVFSYLGVIHPKTEPNKPQVQGVQTSITPLATPADTIGVPVVKVVDGDTITVMLDGKKQTVRVIGIDTPETVDPRKPVQCFGKAASDRAKELLTNRKVLLEADATQDNTDKYGRLLRYVYINGTDDYGLGAILEGYAHEYTYKVPYKYQLDYKKAEKAATNAKVGLWADGACGT